MGYAHIENLYKNTLILQFKKCYEMEKTHGTSAHIKRNKDGTITFSSGGASHNVFVSLFNEEELKAKFIEHFGGVSTVTIYGEAYGGKEQGMRLTYGDKLCFIVFDISVTNDDKELWLDVPVAADFAAKMGLEFTPYSEIEATLENINAARDKPSEVAVRRGCGNNVDKFGFNPPIREGTVLRPLIQVVDMYGNRIVSKHKRDEFSERAQTPKVEDAAKIKVLEEATAIAEEWVTPMRLEHVLDKMGNTRDLQKIPQLIVAMIEDVYREGKGEIVENKDVEKAIGKKAVHLFKTLVKTENLK